MRFSRVSSTHPLPSVKGNSLLSIVGVPSLALTALVTASYLISTGVRHYTLEQRLRKELLRETYRLADRDEDHFVSPRELYVLGKDLRVVDEGEAMPRVDLLGRIREARLEAYCNYITSQGGTLSSDCRVYFSDKEEIYSLP